MDSSKTPPQHILDLMLRGQEGSLTTPERQALQSWLTLNSLTIDPGWAAGIDAVLQQTGAETPVAPPSAAPSATTSYDWTGALQDVIAAPPPDNAASSVAPPPATASSPVAGDFGTNPSPDPSAAAPADPALVFSGPRWAPDRRDPSSRHARSDRGTPDYGLDQPGIGGDSAFAGLDPGSLGTIADNPDIAARYLARKRGNENGAPILSESMRNALALSGMGLLGGARGQSSSGKRDLSSIPGSSGEKLRRAENWLGQMDQQGTFADPQAAYKKMFHRVRNTDPGLMSTGQGEAGDMENQINVTTGALLDAATASGLDEDNLGWLQTRLGQAAQEYVMGVAEGSIDPVLMSYPNWLRREKHAQRWLGRQ